MPAWRSVRAVAALVAAGAVGAGLGEIVRRDGGDAHGSPIAEGRALAERLGCFACHGPGGTQPIANPGAIGERVPSWGGGTWMMFNESPEDVREWILTGGLEGHRSQGDPLLAMPAYERWLDAGELDLLAAYVLAVSQFGWPEEEGVARGREIAVRLGCLGCHGPEGRGGVANPGALKGYIPGWEGADFLELVPDRAAFDEWVTDGVSARLAANPAAGFFLRRQAIEMPAYGDVLGPEDLDALYAYVLWIRENPRL